MGNLHTRIRMLMNLRNVACQRNDAVETASSIGGRSNAEWAAASRVWSRQSEALMLAIIAEPPTNLADALSVLSCLAEMRNQHDVTEDPSPHRARDVVEMTDVAIQNCIVALAGNAVPDEGYSETEISDIDWSAAQVAQWLPKPTDDWAAAVAERARFEAAENAAADAGNDTEADAQQELRFAAEEKLMAISAPDGAGLALKVMIAIGNGRASIPYQEAIEADARRLAQEVRV